MYPIAQGVQRPGRGRGFTMIEVMVVVVIIGILMAVGIPAMQRWAKSGKAVAAVEFYREGLNAARREALSHNSASRLVLSTNAVTGQFDWQVDICFPAEAAACTATTGNWSTVAAIAGGDPDTTNGYKSVLRKADALPKTDVLKLSLRPASNDKQIYFTSSGWINTAHVSGFRSIRFSAPDGATHTIQPAALVVGLAGLNTRCDYTILPASNDSRACP